MTEAEFLAIAAEILGTKVVLGPERTDTSATFDSLDLIELWCVLERRLGTPFMRDRFRPTTSLRQLYDMVRK